MISGIVNKPEKGSDRRKKLETDAEVLAKKRILVGAQLTRHLGTEK